ncbi:hypothetical protein Pint_10674 [Pistacia integerrima]|uniref:Uncharacterized protein n=1 Tax=Pistacia integerrima TaxID=434235 RepID=A0ACC0XEY7_9ROSI|nr:hypothetical protein Pint_10674 [Pistacia integerrima]
MYHSASRSDGLGSALQIAGCGQSCKIGNQIVGSANPLGLSEALTFAERAGLDLKKVLEGIRRGSAGNMIMELFGPGGIAESLVKDLGMGLDLLESEEERAVALPGASLCKQLLCGMIANGDEKLGLQGLVTVIERINDIQK